MCSFSVAGQRHLQKCSAVPTVGKSHLQEIYPHLVSLRRKTWGAKEICAEKELLKFYSRCFQTCVLNKNPLPDCMLRNTEKCVCRNVLMSSENWSNELCNYEFLGT